jgi:MFS family permease
MMPPMPPNVSAPVSPDELRGLRLAQGGALTSLVYLLLALVAPVIIILVSGIEIHYGGFHVGTGKFNDTVFEDLVAVLSVGFLVAIVAVVLYLLSFVAFRKVQNGFGGPMGLVVVGILGMFLIFVGFVDVLQQFLAAASCLAHNTTSDCISVGSLYGAVLAVFFGFIFALVGWIGLILGIYRIGKRYGSAVTRVGAILMIVPIANLVAPILILVGVHASLRSVETRAHAP